MFKFPKKFTDRVQSRLRSYKVIAQSHRQKDVSEADTVTVVKDILSDVFGYNKYEELTSEHQIRGTFCDLAIKIDGKIKFLIEVKSAGTALSENHLRQALNYGANQGIEWIILTNSIEWVLYKVKFGQPIGYDRVSDFSIIDLDPKKEDDLSKLFIVAKEGMSSDAIQNYHQHQQIINKFTISQILISESITSLIRRELRRIFPDVKIDQNYITEILLNEVVKRELVEGEKVKEAASIIRKAVNKNARAAAKASEKPVTGIDGDQSPQ
jgi:hypothetical protein